LNNTVQITCCATALQSAPVTVTQQASPGIQQMPGDASRVHIHAACAGNPSLPCEVATFLTNLPSEQRTALMLRRFHQRGYADIAATLGCTEHEARATVHDAIRALRAHVGDRL
jgi:hypothetical protein